jgi:tetratricopeptide (TPR) repeat protein
LQDPDVYYDKNIEGLLQNYRTAFLQVIEYYTRIKDFEKAEFIMSEMEKNVPSSVIPWTNRYLQLIKESYALSTEQVTLDSILASGYSEQDLQIIGENLYRLRLYDHSRKIFEDIYDSNPINVKALSILIDIFDRTRQYKKGVEYLEEWLEKHPQDPQAKAKLSYFQGKSKTLQ